MSSNFPSIGDVVLDPRDEFTDTDGTKYDLLLADGSVVDKYSYPRTYHLPLMEDPAYPNYTSRANIFTCAHIYETYWPSLDFTDTNQNGYDVRFGQTYVQGQGTHIQSRGSSTGAVTVPEKVIPLLELTMPMRIQVSSSTNSTIDSNFQWKQGNSNILKIRGFVEGGLVKIGVTAGTEAEVVILGSAYDLVDILVSVENNTVHVQEFYTLEKVVVTADIDSASQFTASSTASRSVSKATAFSVIERCHRLLPTIASPDPTCPYRVVADLTTKVNIVDSTDPFGDGSLVTKYQLNGDAQDLLGNHHGTATNVTYTEGKFDQAGVFDGSVSRIRTTDGNLGLGAKSISAWVKVNTLNVYNHIICDSDVSLTGEAVVRGTALLVHPTANQVMLAVKEAVRNNWIISVLSTTQLEVGVWYHIVATWDGTTNANGVMISVNGEKTYGTATGTQTSTPTGGKISVGVNTQEHTTPYTLNGALDQIEVYNRALTEEEVDALYTQTIRVPA